MERMSDEHLRILAVPDPDRAELSALRIEVKSLRAELAAARRGDDGEVAHALVCLDTIRQGSHFGKAFSADELIGIITRLSAAKAESERRLATAREALSLCLIAGNHLGTPETKP